jgi:hemolysin III
MHQSAKEERANAVTHGIGTVLAVAALVILVLLAAWRGTVWHVVSFSIFGATLVLLYAASTLYHTFTQVRLKNLFNKIDHIAIYLLIAGTYTPFCLTVLRGWIGWSIFGVVWGCALTGVIVKSISVGRFVLLSTIFYILMGWIILIAIVPLYQRLTAFGFGMVMAGGAFYTLGTVFFLRDHIRYNHSVWHVFVIGGSLCHFFAVLSLLEQ